MWTAVTEISSAALPGPESAQPDSGTSRGPALASSVSPVRLVAWSAAQFVRAGQHASGQKHDICILLGHDILILLRHVKNSINNLMLNTVPKEIHVASEVGLLSLQRQLPLDMHANVHGIPNENETPVRRLPLEFR